MTKSFLETSIEINAPAAKVWECWTKPEHINSWAFANTSWGAGARENDVRVGGKFLTRLMPSSP
jgi:uncharacterized protein YndB with AHSA1/START domain